MSYDYGHRHEVEDHGYQVGLSHPQELRIAGEPPDAPVQIEQNEDDYAKYHVHRHEPEPGIEICARNGIDPQVEPEKERSKIRSRGGKYVIDHQEPGYDLPMLQ